MQEVADGDGGSGFAFTLPVSSAWAARLKAIELSEPGGGHLGTLAGVAADPGAIASVLRDAADLEILISRGIPAPEQWRR